MSVYVFNIGEIYEDKNGNRWLVTGGWTEPTVEMQRIEPIWSDGLPAPTKQFGGVNGLMWDGFEKILEAPKQRHTSKASPEQKP